MDGSGNSAIGITNRIDRDFEPLRADNDLYISALTALQHLLEGAAAQRSEAVMDDFAT